MPSLRILHISDLHARGDREKDDAWRRNRVLNGTAWQDNLRELVDPERPFDLVCFTGDIADWGKQEEYAATTPFIRGLCDTLKVPLDRFFVVPGNHDINRYVESKSWKKLRKRAGEVDSRQFSAWIADSGRVEKPVGRWRDGVLQRQVAFWKWVSEDLGREVLLPTKSPHGRLGYRALVELPRCPFPIHIVGLDSAWLAGADDDSQRLRLTVDQAGRLTTGQGKPLPGLRIGLIHHPLTDLADVNDCKPILAENLDLLLRGHLHHGAMFTENEPGRSLCHLAAGCLYEGEHGMHWRNSCQVIDIETDEKGRPQFLDIRFRGWSQAGHWYDDGSLYEPAQNGRLRWDLAVPAGAKPGGRASMADLRLDQLRLSWEQAKKRLRARYAPDLHVVGHIEEVLHADLFSAALVEGRHSDLMTSAVAMNDAAKALREIATLLRPEDDIGSQDYLQAAASAEMLGAVASSLAERLLAGPAGEKLAVPDITQILLLQTKLSENRLYSSLFHYDTPKLLTQVKACYGQVSLIMTEWDEASHPRALIGPPGSGKTHAAADMVARHLENGQPALFVVAKDHRPTEGVRAILSRLVDQPNWSSAVLLEAMEALAQRSVSPGARGFGRCLLVIDGLEESTSWQDWQQVLDELAVLVKPRPRIHLVVTMRRESSDVLNLDGFSTTFLRESSSDLGLLFAQYTAHYKIDASAIPWAPWALNSPFAIRLFAQLYRGRRFRAEDGFSRSVVQLVRMQRERIEEEARARAAGIAWSSTVPMVTHVLLAIGQGSLNSLDSWVSEADILSQAQKSERECEPDRVRSVLALSEEHGVIESQSTTEEGLAPPQIRYRFSNHQIGDFVLGDAAARAILTQGSEGPFDFPVSLLPHWRTNAMNIFAAILAENGVFVADEDVWRAKPSFSLATAQLVALSWVAPGVGELRRQWVESLLLRSTRANRTVLELLVVPVSRIPGHPLGARSLDSVLHAVKLAERDLIWSVPEHLTGKGPWTGAFSSVLDQITLDPMVDSWDGRPLILAWSCASVVEDRRRRAREALGEWGAGNLAQMTKLLNHMANVDDPQIIEDLVSATLGAVIGADLKLDKTQWVTLAKTLHSRFLSVDATTWIPDVVVRANARAVLEQISLLQPGSIDDLLKACRPPYVQRGPEWPAIDRDEAIEIATKGYSSIITDDYDAYIARDALELFFENLGRSSKTVPSEHIALIAHAASVLGQEVDGHAIRNGMLAAQVKAFGWRREKYRAYVWDGEASLVDDAISQLYHPGRHQVRSAIATIQEKYIWLAVNAVAGMLLERLPVWNEDTARWEKHLDDLSRVGTRQADPLPRTSTLPDGVMEGSISALSALPPPMFADVSDLIERANRWLESGPEPDLESLIHGHVESWNDGLILALDSLRTGHELVLTQRLWITGLAVSRRHFRLFQRDLKKNKDMVVSLHDWYAYVKGATYHSAAIASWAPWLTFGQSAAYRSVAERGQAVDIEVFPLAARIMAEDHSAEEQSEEHEVFLPGPLLRDECGVVRGAGRRGLNCYLRRDGSLAALYREVRDDYAWKASHRYLAAGFDAVMNACARRDLVPFWSVRLFREANPALWSKNEGFEPPSALKLRARNTYWIVLLNERTTRLEAHQLGTESETFGPTTRGRRGIHK